MQRHTGKQKIQEITDEDKTLETYEERFHNIVESGMICLGIALGQKVGLLDILINSSNPQTSEEIAKQDELNERYVREWLFSMVAAKIVFVTDDLKYYIPDECKPGMKTRLYSTVLPAAAKLTPDVEKCFRSADTTSAGYDFSKSEDICKFMNEDRKKCDQKWIEDTIVPQRFKENKGLVRKILDIGCGIGSLTINIAKYFPEAEVIGVDIDEFAYREALESKQVTGLKNVNFRLANAGNLDKDWVEQFDWITVLTVLHDLPDPDSCVREISRVIKRDGIVTVLDPVCHSDPRKNVGNQITAASLTISCFVCLPCSLSAPPFAGNGIGWGFENRADYLRKMGFNVISDETGSVIHCTKKNDRLIEPIDTNELYNN